MRVGAPRSPGAERYVITCCLNQPDTVLELHGKLEPSDFYNPLYRDTYRVCTWLVENELAPEPMVIFNQLQKLGAVEPEWLAELELLAKASYDLKNLQEVVNEVKEYSVRRQLISAAEDSIEELTEEDLGIQESISAVENRVLEISTKALNIEDVVCLGDGLREFVAERRDNPVLLPGLATGFPKLDEELLGLEAGRLYVVAGRYKSGKSIMLMNIAAHVGVNLEVPVLIIDTENQTEQMRSRILSMVSGVEERSIRQGTFGGNKALEDKVEMGLDILNGAPIYHHYMPYFTFESCLSIIRRYRAQKNIGLVVFDYIKIPENSLRDNIREHQMLGILTDGLHNKVAGAMDIPVLTAAQLGRSAIGASEERDDHVADSDRIGRYTDVLMYLREKSQEEKERYGCSPMTGNRVLTVQTNRGGPAKEYAYDIWFDAPVQLMTEVRARRLSV